MSDMKKCDHCGATVDVTEEKLAGDTGWAKVEVFQQYNDGHGTECYWTSDLCPACVAVVHPLCGNTDLPEWPT